MARRQFDVFSMSFLDTICCAFGAIVLLYMIINASSGRSFQKDTAALRAEADRLEQEVLEGYQSLADARKAVAAKDNARAAEAMTAAARALEKQAAQAAKMEQQRAVADEKLARETRQRMDKLVKQLDATAAQLKAGKLATPAALDKALTQAQRADLERRWLVTDVTTWYPVVEQPQTHFLAAAEAYAKKDYKAAATEVRKAAVGT